MYYFDLFVNGDSGMYSLYAYARAETSCFQAS